MLSTPLVPSPSLLFWSPVCPQTWCGTGCVLALPSPLRCLISSSGLSPKRVHLMARRAAAPSPARPAPSPPRRVVLRPLWWLLSYQALQEDLGSPQGGHLLPFPSASSQRQDLSCHPLKSLEAVSSLPSPPLGFELPLFLSCGRLPAGLSASMLRLHPSPKAAARVMFLECN